MTKTRISCRAFLILLTGWLLTSCGYHFGTGSCFSESLRTISVPYIEGDLDGALTSAVIKEIAGSGSFEYCSYGGGLILQIKLIDLRDENIGFRYDRKKKGKLKKSIIPTETRRFALVEVALQEASGNILLGPVKLSANFDFDHDYYSSRDAVNIFSLGQLSDIDAAYDAVECPLYRGLAKKIVDFICNN